jgi:hypothetical protein
LQTKKNHLVDLRDTINNNNNNNCAINIIIIDDINIKNSIICGINIIIFITIQSINIKNIIFVV